MTRTEETVTAWPPTKITRAHTLTYTLTPGSQGQMLATSIDVTLNLHIYIVSQQSQRYSSQLLFYCWYETPQSRQFSRKHVIILLMGLLAIPEDWPIMKTGSVAADTQAWCEEVAGLYVPIPRQREGRE